MSNKSVSFYEKYFSNRACKPWKTGLALQLINLFSAYVTGATGRDVFPVANKQTENISTFPKKATIFDIEVQRGNALEAFFGALSQGNHF